MTVPIEHELVLVLMNSNHAHIINSNTVQLNNSYGPIFWYIFCLPCNSQALFLIRVLQFTYIEQFVLETDVFITVFWFYFLWSPPCVYNLNHTPKCIFWTAKKIWLIVLIYELLLHYVRYISTSCMTIPNKTQNYNNKKTMKHTR